MGEKKQYRLQMDFPFYTQRMTQETWEGGGFSSFHEADSWTFRSCGIASLRMILEGLGKQVERHGTMIAKGVGGQVPIKKVSAGFTGGWRSLRRITAFTARHCAKKQRRT